MKEQKKERIDFKFNFTIYLDIVKRYIPYVVIILSVSLLVEASVAADKLLFKLIIDRGTDLAGGKLAVELFVRLLAAIAAGYGGIILMRSLAKFAHLHFINELESRLIFDLKNKFFGHLVGLSHEFHTTHKSGSLISRLSRGGRAVEGMTDIFLFQFAPLFFQLVAVSISLVCFSWIPMVTVLATVAVFIAYSLILQNIQQPYNLAANNADDREKGFIGDVFANVDSIKYYGKEGMIRRRYADSSGTTRDAMRTHWHFYRFWDAGQTIILGAGAFALVAYPVYAFMHHAMTLGTVVFIYTLYGNIIGPLFGFVHGMRQFYRAMADFESLFQYAKIENSIKDAPSAPPMKVPNGKIELKGVSFRYHKKNVFTDFSLSIRMHERVALVGRSGCGKTTLVKLLYRLYDVDEGCICIDGVNIRDVAQESLRRSMAIVPQECMLFDDTVYNNIAFSNPDAPRKDVLAAMRFAQLDVVVKSFPLEENTIVGERGVKLSGGEKQRVSIARALLAKTKIVVLDEATSSLDSKTEHDIQRDLARLLRGRTAIIIAHRLSTIMNADRIIVLERGRIVDEGRHTELIRRPGVYKKLWNLQKNGYIE
ncbi:MAG: ABC transporter ATP-binding protein [Spirochaetota bacterium]